MYCEHDEMTLVYMLITKSKKELETWAYKEYEI